MMMTISNRGKSYRRELKVLASNVRWRTGRGQATGQGQAIAPTMDALRQPLRQHSRGDGLSSPKAFSFGSIPAHLCDHPGGWLASYALAFALNLAEETVRFTTDTSREEEFIGLARGIAIAEG